MGEAKGDLDAGLEHVEQSAGIQQAHDDVFGEISDDSPNFRNVNHSMVSSDYGRLTWFQVGFVGTIILMMKTQIGLGVLAIPSAFNILGMAPGIVCLLVMAFITTWSGYIIGTFKLQHREVYSIDDAGDILFGLPGRVYLATGFCLCMFHPIFLNITTASFGRT